MKLHPGPAALGTQSMNLALRSEKKISISATFSLVNLFPVCFLPCVFAFCMNGGIHNKCKKRPEWE